MGTLAGPLSATNERARAGELSSSAGRGWGRIEKLGDIQHQRITGARPRLLVPFPAHRVMV
jgi:hypothetical protein